MHWYWIVLIAFIWSQFVFGFGKGFGRSLEKLPYKWNCYACDEKFACTNTEVLTSVAFDHVKKLHPKEIQDGATTSSEEGSR